ncbi:MAG TPA: class I adenylate-forming enzyme family protein [Xanthobacteraceae bacterium]|nr:class I adenylate-forming enzyme family protein [Xanthobacteraceae bacterium]
MEIVLLQRDDAPVSRNGVPFGDRLGEGAAVSAGATNLAAAVAAVAHTRADHPAVATTAGDFTYGWVLRAADTVRRHLHALPGFAAGARVALQIANAPEYLAAFYGTLLADGVVVPLPVALEARRRQAILDLCSPDVLIGRADDLDAATATATATLRLAASDDDGVTAAPQRGGDDLAMLLFTSGSTGTPKGVMLSHRNLIANAGAILRDLPIRADDRALAVLPFCHAFGNSILQTHVLAGATLVLHEPTPFPAAIVEALAARGATSFAAVPELYGMLHKFGGLGARPLPALRYMTVAGGALRPDLAAGIAARIAPATFHVMYGQSEATARLASLAPGELGVRCGSIGKPIAGVTLAVHDEAGRDAVPGAVGMLCARGDNVMLGYWNDPAATAEVLGPDGWLRTGDLAHCDADGYFYVHGRANLLVKVQGHRVHPAEIEGVVEASFPHAQAVAIPMARGDDTRFALFLAPRDERPLDVATIRAACQRELPGHKVPLHFEVLDRLPLTSGHKVDRAALGRRLAEAATPAA